jgi:hypothetical protein
MFYNRCFGSCANSTMISALRNRLFKLPDLSLERYLKNLPNQTAQAYGHLDRTRKGQRSTKAHVHRKSVSTPIDTLPVIPDSLAADDVPTIFVKDFSAARMHVDATGRFPVASVNGYSYDLIFYVEGFNYIHVELLRDRTAVSYTKAYRKAFEFFTLHNIPCRIVRLDNETSGSLLRLFTNLGIRAELAPPSNHRTLHAERHIRTWKNHFVSTLATCDPSFPLDAWEHLVPQAETTLNLLRPSLTRPTISAWEHVCGQFDFNATPLAPAGTRAVILEPLRPTWGKHGIDCFYVGPAYSHYRCYTFYVPATRDIRISDSIAWFPLPTLIAPPTPLSLAQFAIDDLTSALTQLSFCTPLESDSALQLTQQLTDLVSQSKIIFDPTYSPPPPPAVVSPFIEDSSIPVHTVPPSSSSHATAQLSRVLGSVDIITTPLPLSTPSVTRVVDLTPFPQDILVPIPVPQVKVSFPLQSPYSEPPPGFAALPIPTVFAPVPSIRPSRRRKPNSRYFAANAANERNLQTENPYDSMDYFMNLAEAVQRADMDSPPSYGAAISGPEPQKWIDGFATEIHRLVTKTQTGRFVSARTKPLLQRVAYARIVCRLKHRISGLSEHRVRITYGRTTPGESIYSGDLAAYTASMSTVKLLLNAVVSEDAKFLTTDITDFYLGTPIGTPEYMWIPYKYFSPQLISQYNLQHLHHNGLILMELNKSIYGLPQAGILSQRRLLDHLSLHGYNECPQTSCLFRHTTKNIYFTLVVDDFAIKYHMQEDVDHLLSTLQQFYTLRTDWHASSYLGLTIAYVPGSGSLTISMPSYVHTALKTLGATDIGHASTPMLSKRFAYGSKAAQQAHVDTSTPLDAAKTKRLQVICGIFLYYSRVLDFRIATAVNSLSSRQSKPTIEVEAAATQLLQYLSAHPDFSITYRRSDMRLITHADASHHSESNARSRAGRVEYLGDNNDDTAINGPIDCASVIIDCVTAGTYESEYAALFISCQKSVTTRNALADLGYPQGPTLVVCDNKCASGIASDSVTQRRSKAMDMRFHWTRDRVRQGQFSVVWRPGIVNLADIFTKALPKKEFAAASQKLALSKLAPTTCIP